MTTSYAPITSLTTATRQFREMLHAQEIGRQDDGCLLPAIPFPPIGDFILHLREVSPSIGNRLGHRGELAQLAEAAALRPACLRAARLVRATTRQAGSTGHAVLKGSIRGKERRHPMIPEVSPQPGQGLTELGASNEQPQVSHRQSWLVKGDARDEVRMDQDYSTLSVTM